MKYYNISIVGSGNLAWHLAQDLERAGHSIKEIYSRDIENAELLADQLYDTQPTDDLNFIYSEAELIIIAVTDDSIPTVVEQLILPPACSVVHTSGAVPMDVLTLLGANIGVFYPLQSFTTEWPVDFKKVPIFIEASNKPTQELLTNIARSLSRQVYQLPGEKRQILHVSAVIASNFVNHLLFLATELTERNGLDKAWLQPIIEETVAKGFELGFYESQTGPARRGDIKTINKHLALLTDLPNVASIYKAMTESIRQHY